MAKPIPRPICPKCGMKMIGIAGVEKFECLKCGYVEDEPQRRTA